MIDYLGCALPNTDSFDSYPVAGEARYLMDMPGSFEVAACGSGRSGRCVRPMSEQAPIYRTSQLAEPYALLGDLSWTNYTVSSGAGQGVTAQFDNLSITPGGGGGSGGSGGVLRGTGSGRCLDVPNASPADGSRLELWDCNGGTNQQWTLNSSGAPTVYGTKCLDVPGAATGNGGSIDIGTCSGAPTGGGPVAKAPGTPAGFVGAAGVSSRRWGLPRSTGLDGETRRRIARPATARGSHT